MEENPEKRDGTPHHAHSAWCNVYCPFFQGIPPSTEKNCYCYYLSFNSKCIMSKIQFDVNAANGIAIEVANDVLLVWWMEVYLFRVDQSKSLFQAKIKWYFNFFLNFQYCEWLNFRGGPLPMKLRFSIWVMNENIMVMNFEPQECIIFLKSKIIGISRK